MPRTLKAQPTVEDSVQSTRMDLQKVAEKDQSTLMEQNLDLRLVLWKWRA